MSGCITAGKRSDEKKVPDSSHIGSCTTFMSPLTA
jgi:hypothetical protein